MKELNESLKQKWISSDQWNTLVMRLHENAFDDSFS